MENCVMNKIKQMENEGYERLPHSEDVTIAAIKDKDDETFNDINIQNIIENSANKNKIKLSLSQEQIYSHAVYPTTQSNVNHERLPNESSTDLKKSTCKTIAKHSSTIPLAIHLERIRLNEKNEMNEEKNEFSEVSEFSMTENEKSNLLRKFSVSVIGTKIMNQRKTNLFDFNNLDNARVLKEEFKCTICKDAFQDPRVLDCLHSFCMDCLVDAELVKYTKSKNNDLCELDLSCKH